MRTEKSGCGVFLFILILNVLFGGWSVNYILEWFSKDIPFIADILIGLFLGEFTIPIAIVGWILRICGVF